MSDEKKITTQDEGLYDRLGRCDRTEYEHAELHHHIAEVGQSMPPFPCKNWRAGTFTPFTPAAPVSPPRYKPYACVGNSSAAQDERSEAKEVFGEVAPVSPEPHPEEVCDDCGAELIADSGQGEGVCPKCDVREAKTEGAKPEPQSPMDVKVANGEYWRWQADGDDHLESLSCPILIDANQLRALLKQSLPSPAPQESVYEVCAQIAEKFLGAMTAEEWPPCGLCPADGRFDAGVSKLVAERIAAAIRAASPAQPVGAADKEQK